MKTGFLPFEVIDGSYDGAFLYNCENVLFAFFVVYLVEEGFQSVAVGQELL